MTSGFETRSTFDGRVETSVPLSNRDYFPQHDLISWTEAVTTHHGLQRRSTSDRKSWYIAGLREHLEKRARAAAIGSCGLKEECRLQIQMPGMETGDPEGSALQLHCTALENASDDERRIGEQRCRTHHEQAPFKLAAFITEIVAEYGSAKQARDAANQAFMNAIYKL